MIEASEDSAKIACKESGSDIKAIYQIPHFDLRKQRKNQQIVICWEKLKIKFEMDGKLCPGIQPPISIMLQVSRPETSLKWDSSTGILWNFVKFFKKPYLQNTSWWLFLLISQSQPKCYPLMILSSFFPSFFPFLIYNHNCGSLFRKGIKMKIFYFLQ